MHKRLKKKMKNLLMFDPLLWSGVRGQVQKSFHLGQIFSDNYCQSIISDKYCPPIILGEFGP